MREIIALLIVVIFFICIFTVKGGNTNLNYRKRGQNSDGEKKEGPG